MTISLKSILCLLTLGLLYITQVEGQLAHFAKEIRVNGLEKYLNWHRNPPLDLINEVAYKFKNLPEVKGDYVDSIKNSRNTRESRLESSPTRIWEEGNKRSNNYHGVTKIKAPPCDASRLPYGAIAYCLVVDINSFYIVPGNITVEYFKKSLEFFNVTFGITGFNENQPGSQLIPAGCNATLGECDYFLFVYTLHPDADYKVLLYSSENNLKNHLSGKCMITNMDHNSIGVLVTAMKPGLPAGGTFNKTVVPGYFVAYGNYSTTVTDKFGDRYLFDDHEFTSNAPLGDDPYERTFIDLTIKSRVMQDPDGNPVTMQTFGGRPRAYLRPYGSGSLEKDCVIGIAGIEAPVYDPEVENPTCDQVNVIPDN